MGRLLAVIAALGMIVGAFVYRYGVPGGGGDGDGGGGGGGGGIAAGRLVCATELGDAVCAALPNALVEPAGTTADRLIAVRSASEAEIAGWLAPGPWAEMVDGERVRTSKPKLFSTTADVAVASAPIIVVTRRGQVPPGCPAEPTWKCLGDAAQNAPFRIGGDPVSTSSGLFLRAAALSGFFGRADFATNDLDETPEARPWFDTLNTKLAAAAGFGATSLPDFVAKQGSANAYLTGGAAAGFIGGNVSFDIKTPTPAVTVAVTFAPAARGARDVDTDALREPLRAAGWSVRPNAKTEGLPSPGVLLALRSS